MKKLVGGPSLRSRRKRIRATQEEIAERVRQLSGEKFSQQALGKYENNKNANSRFVIFIIEALRQLEQERLPHGVSSIVSQAPGRPHTEKPLSSAKFKDQLADLSPSELIEILPHILPHMTPEERLQLARIALSESPEAGQ